MSEASATSLMCAGRLLQPALPAGSNVNPNFVAMTTRSRNGAERLADELLVRERAVGFGGVEERHAAFDGGPHERDHLLPVHRRAVREAHSHAAEPEGRHFQIALAKCARLHRLFLETSVALIRAAIDGAGVAYMLEAHATPHLRSRALVRVLEDWCPPFAGYFLYYPSRRQQPAALSALIETLRL